MNWKRERKKRSHSRNSKSSKLSLCSDRIHQMIDISHRIVVPLLWWSLEREMFQLVLYTSIHSFTHNNSMMPAVSVYDFSLDHGFIGLPTTECTHYTAIPMFLLRLSFSFIRYWLMWKSDLISATSHAGWFSVMYSRWDMGEWSISMEVHRRFNWKKKRGEKKKYSKPIRTLGFRFRCWKICCCCCCCCCRCCCLLYWSLLLIKWFIV